MSRRLSIITVCLNDRQGLQRTLASIRSQTVQDADLIVVDGGSTDGSVELIKEQESAITIWTSEPDQGIYDAQNKGWYMANTSYVLFMNAGDEFASADVLEKALPELDDRVDILYGDALLARDGERVGRKEHPAHLGSAYLMRETVAHQAQFIKRELLEHLEGYDTRYRIAADYDLLARAFWKVKAECRHLPMPVCVFDLQGTSSRAGNEATRDRERKEIQRRLAPRFWYLLYHGWAAFNKMIGR